MKNVLAVIHKHLVLLAIFKFDDEFVEAKSVREMLRELHDSTGYTFDEAQELLGTKGEEDDESRNR